MGMVQLYPQILFCGLRCPGPTLRSELCRSTHVSVHDSRAPWLRSLAYVVEGWTPLMSSRVQFRQLQSRLQLAIHWTLIDDTLLECTVPTGYVPTVPPPTVFPKCRSWRTRVFPTFPLRGGRRGPSACTHICERVRSLLYAPIVGYCSARSTSLLACVLTSLGRSLGAR